MQAETTSEDLQARLKRLERKDRINQYGKRRAALREVDDYVGYQWNPEDEKAAPKEECENCRHIGLVYEGAMVRLNPFGSIGFFVCRECGWYSEI